MADERAFNSRLAIIFIFALRLGARERSFAYNGDMDDPRRREITTRILRPRSHGTKDQGELETDSTWSTPEERIEAVWELTLLCLEWRGEPGRELRLQRSISRVQRPGS